MSYQRRLGPSPTRKRHLDPDLECNPKRRATDRNMNTRFDSMIETISTVHDRLESPRYISRMRKKRTDNLTDGLSFVKTAGATSFSSEFCDARDSNDSAQVSHVSTSRRRSCNPLPDWLANTFMLLSKKHPLRLLVPSDLAKAFLRKSRSQGTETESPFAFMDNRPTENDPHDRNLFLQQTVSSDNGPIAMDPLHDSDLPEPLPYCTPDPISQFGGFSVASKTALSAAYSYSSSSPTLFNTESHVSLHKQIPQPRNHASPIASTAFRHGDGNWNDDFDSDPAPFHVADNPYLSQIYTTPGPTFRAPTIQYDSPIKDPQMRGHQATRSRSTSDGSHLDFHWRPYDRKKLVPPVISKAPAFADDEKRFISKPFSDNTTIATIDRPPLEISRTQYAGQLEAVSPVSPSPFSFSPLDETDMHIPPVQSAVDPESHDPPKGSQTPPLQMLPSALAPAIYTPPLSSPPGRTSGSLFFSEAGIFFKNTGSPEGRAYSISEDSLTPSDAHNVGSEHSLSSLDSVDFCND